MPRDLPPRAHLRQLKHQAKDLVCAHRKQDKGVCSLLRRLRRFATASDAEILSSSLKLSDAQFALALDYGFASWNALKQAVSEHAQWAPDVSREGDAVFVRNLEQVAWGGPHAKQNSVMAAFEAAVAALGGTRDYDALMATSGAAFRLQHKWCPSSPHAQCGFDCSELAARAAGYRLDWLRAKDTRVGDWQYAEGLATAHARATACIDEGSAVLWSSEECGLLVGYAESGEWLVRPYAPGEPGYTRTSDWPWYFGILKKNGEPLSGIESAVHVLQTAARLAHTAAFGPYTSGFAAYERWVNELRAGEIFSDEASWFQIALGNAHTYACLADARAAGSRYLEQLSTDLPDSPSVRVRQAAAAFAEVGQLVTGAPDAPKPWQLFPWCFESPAEWTHDQRLAQANVLEAARRAEERGVAALEAALSELGIEDLALER